ncbi:NAD-dependent succinate-semialdehyde dehydrogenase [Pseudonocardia sp. KRD-184]|uniref:NAD-dependent succinate-semialdehyde dehydrogenase n=1 Tax=Pseudonocardia oceani TaxID=2792013 RepID=A0ABS6UJP3_9PSEU|nr:NAD-dependent succinate-semialdehyde dehydrogenase [Pseudonocardia oceani]MBW0092435.1 NAD-dependent succinate-semialdehyde dehydrogenase [Pseudonocardia oceani]MBW0098681.1 NAD-dependent succinate-semialdehyde dehydrogenase [Pseudonocardia oceani]MBW0111967.1 NAD-dependent succinate-semialdehyde dehydrogenase [Pseudonocardia oceani]MBW0124248.1 NAD-dependent succinate-semialdehyde dehydrogenase [Pseudonocardia oceani]MBW0132103.1 NAD-dependent succinate-semialdehyde dehydrogenase [Pseudono
MTNPTDEARVLDAVPTGLFIGGSWRPAASGATLAVDDPATGTTLVEVADAGPEDGMEALAAAAAAQSSFAAMAPRARGEILRRAYELLMERIDDLALLMTMEMGKPLAESKGEITYAAEFFRWFSEEAVRIDGGYAIAPAGTSRFMVMKQPVGVCLLITPWNFPMAMGTRKIGPAIAAGCAMVIKPSELTPLSMHALAAILVEAGLPDGVLNVVTTSNAGAVMEPLIRDGRARKLSFTGSTAVGKKLLEQASDKVLRTSMELGGNAPLIVFDDADLDKAVEGAMAAKMRNMGEACTAANRFLVHRSVADAFADKLAARMEALVVGRGTEEGVQVGPLVNAKSREKVVTLVQDALDKGASVKIGAEPGDGPGHFYPPTVLTGVPLEARLSHEEIFGPVAAITVFDEEDEAVAAANDTEFGLVSYLFTENLTRALRVSERLEAGMIGLNTGLVSNPAAPFGGIKESGLGREGGSVGIDEFLETKYVGIAFGG